MVILSCYNNVLTPQMHWVVQWCQAKTLGPWPRTRWSPSFFFKGFKMLSALSWVWLGGCNVYCVKHSGCQAGAPSEPQEGAPSLGRGVRASWSFPTSTSISPATRQGGARLQLVSLMAGCLQPGADKKCSEKCCITKIEWGKCQMLLFLSY